MVQAFVNRRLAAVRLMMAALMVILTMGCEGNLLLDRPADKKLAASGQAPAAAVAVVGIAVSGAGNVTNVIQSTTLQMNAVVTPPTATNPAVVWSVVNGTGTATISAAGLLTGTGLGTVTVKAAATDGSGVVGTKGISVTSPAIPVTSVTVTSAGNVTSIVHLSTLQMSASVLPVNASDPTVVWSVVNGTGTATISPLGLLTATGVGTVTVWGTANDGSGKSASKVITITPILATSMTVNGTTTDNSVFQMSAVFTPANTDNQTVNWSLTGAGASINSSTGVVTANTTGGSVTVKATANDGSGVTATKTLTITPKLDSPTITSVRIHAGYENGRTVSVAAAVTVPAAGTTIYYTADGTTPTVSSSLYAAPFDLTGNYYTPTVKAIAVKAGFTNSDPASVTLPTMYYPVYAGARNNPLVNGHNVNGVWASFDGGATFSLTPLYLPTDPNPANADPPEAINSVSSVYAAGSHVYTVIYNSYNGINGNYFGVEVWSSSDYGTTWTSSLAVERLYNSVTVSGSTVYASFMANGTDGGFWRSDLNTEITNPAWANVSGLQANGVIVVGDKLWFSSTPYNGSGGGVVVYDPTSLSWTNYTTANGLGSNKVLQMVASGSTVYAATDNGVSKFSGTTWTNSTIGLLNPLYGAASSYYVKSITLDGTTLYVSNVNGVSQSSTSPLSFQPISGTDIYSAAKIAAAGGVYYLISDAGSHVGIFYGGAGFSGVHAGGGTPGIIFSDIFVGP